MACQGHLQRGLTAVIQLYGVSTAMETSWNTLKTLTQMVSQVGMCEQLKICNPHKPARTGHAFGISLMWCFLADSLQFLAVSWMFQCWLLQCDMTPFSYAALNTCDLNRMRHYCDYCHLFYL